MTRFSKSIGTFSLRIAVRRIFIMAMICSTLPAAPASAQVVDEADSLALVAFYQGTDGGKWINRTNWLNRPVESWYGVTVTNGRVTRLELPENNVSFPSPRRDPNVIPPEIGDLTQLEVLDLHENVLNADIPPEIGNLVNLKELNLSSNGIGGPIPPELGKLVQLEKLNLSVNQLGGELPVEIGNLVRLKELDVQMNHRLSGAVHSEILNLSQLEHLYVNDNRFEDLPDLSPLDPQTGAGALVAVSARNNHLTFEDIEPNFGQSFAFDYAPQHTPLVRDLFQYEGESLTLRANIGGMYNQYQWYKDGEILPDETANQLEVGPVTREKQGRYALEIRNTFITDLMLVIPNIDIIFTEEYTAQWLDISAYHHAYSESGARHWVAETPTGKEYPAILRHSTHNLANGFWIGIKDWTDHQGEHYPYYVARLGPSQQGAFYTYPIQNRLIGRYEDTLVEVNGEASFDKEAILDEIDPALPADRMVHNVNNMVMGITVDRKIYAYTNEFHDNYHLKEITYCNTGNIDDDEEIELPDQTLHDVIFYSINRWTGSEQSAYATDNAQRWGRYTVHDVVGDGYEEYPVDFTAQYAWAGWTIEGLSNGYSDQGGPLFSDELEVVAPGDSIGRLAGATMMGQSVIHADRTATDSSYDPGQPAYMSWIDNDSQIYHGREPRKYSPSRPATHEQLYELGIVSPPNFVGQPMCTDCRRTYPHMADTNQPNGMFWDYSANEIKLTGRLAGGFSATTGYGPYEMGPGECINIVESEGIAGLSFDAATRIGRAFKRGGNDRNTLVIEYDANGDGQIDTTPFDYDNVFVGTETQTKDQWFMSARDSLFQTFYRARNLYEASQGMTVYPVAEPPRPPTSFSLWGRPRHIDLEWTPPSDGPAINHWELYRTEHWEDNLYVNGCLDDPSIKCGYELVVTLPAETTSYADNKVSPGVDYFYYLQAVGETQSEDPEAIHGTPGGVPLRSGRYLTQTYTPVRMLSGVTTEDTDLPGRFRLHGNYPNPFAGETRIRYELPAAANVELVVYDILGREVEVLIREFQPPGRHEYSFSPNGLASGVYVYVLQAGEDRAEGRMTLVR